MLTTALKPNFNSIVLMYHRVKEPDADLWDLCVAPDNFAEQMEYISHQCNPTRLGSAVRPSLFKKDREIAVTIDDGYIDILENALPVLEKYQIPATVFVPAGSIGRIESYWWDELARIFLSNRRLPAELVFEDVNGCYVWSNPDVDHLPIDQSAREFVCRSIWERLFELKISEIVRHISNLKGWAALGSSAREIMTWSELQKLTESGLVRVGLHGFQHERMKILDNEERDVVVKKSRALLSKHLRDKADLDHFCYPYGDYDRSVVKSMAKCGVKVALTCNSGSVSKYSSQLRLPRIEVKNQGLDQFRDSLRL